MLRTYPLKWRSTFELFFSKALPISLFHSYRHSAATNMTRRSRHEASYIPAREAQTYQYKPLDPEKNEIRLLRMRYAPGNSILCEIFHTTVENAPPYHALSYAWGDKSSIQIISVFSVPMNNGAVLVTPNLKHALLRLKPVRPNEELVIWVDALCIDQMNIPERNVQTGKMRMIYENAQKLYVWIGLKNHGSSEAIQLAQMLKTRSRQEVARILKHPNTAYALEALVQLFRRQYWWRIWVIQEVSCSKETTIYCGDNAIPWKELENVCDVMQEHEEFLTKNLFYKHLSKVHTLTHGGPRGLQLTRYSPSLSNPPLLELLLSHKSKKSTDPKDKVYALVGISSSRLTFGPIDYSLSMRDVFSHTARHIITTSQKLDVICVKQNSTEQFDLPSWVPDWTRKPSTGGNALIGLHHHSPPFAAAGNTKASFAFLDNGLVLKTQGIIIDRINAVGIPYKRKGAPSDILPVLSAYDNWRALFVSYRGSSTSSDEEFGSVISGGNWILSSKESTGRIRLIAALSASHVIRHAADSSPRIYSDAEPGAWEIMDDVQLQKNTTPDGEKEGMAAISSASLMMNRRRLIVSEKSITGLAPWDTEVGDVICVLLGCRIPVILREKNGKWELIGEAYVYGYMDGEAVSGEFQLNTFE